MSVIAKITLIDGSTHQTTLGGGLLQAENDLTNIISNEEILKTENPYGDLLGTQFICGKHIISFNLNEQK